MRNTKQMKKVIITKYKKRLQTHHLISKKKNKIIYTNSHFLQYFLIYFLKKKFCFFGNLFSLFLKKIFNKVFIYL